MDRGELHLTEERAITTLAAGRLLGAQAQRHRTVEIMAMAVQVVPDTMHSQRDHAHHTEQVLHLEHLRGAVPAVVRHLVRHQQDAHTMLLHPLCQHLHLVVSMQEVTRRMV